jgi:hypothetical protein
MDSLKVVTGSSSQACHDKNQVIDIKAEEVTDVQDEQDSFIITCPVIKAEHEVSCIVVCLLFSTCVSYLELHMILLFSSTVCPSV